MEKAGNKFLLNQKWRKFLKLRPFFAYIPFVDFVLVAGSLAFGNVHTDSDFDVIVGARQGRIFTVRFFCIALFGLSGVLQRRTDLRKTSRDKVCFNHFVTPGSYRLRPPHNAYWRELYKNLVPLFGREETVHQFFEANSNWVDLGEVFISKEERWQPERFNVVKRFLESVLWGPLGRIFEWVVKKFQMSRIGVDKSFRRGEFSFKPRLRYDDEELEFHPDTSRIEKMIQEER